MDKIKIIKYLALTCLYGVLLTPLLIFDKFMFPFITPKTLYFRMLIEIAVFFYVILALYQPQYRPRFNKITWVVLIYLLVMTLVSLFGVDPFRSFWSNIERGEGLITLYHLFAFLIILTSLFRTKQDWLKFIKFSIGVSLAVSLYALAQKLNMSFVVHPGEGRLMSTLGNPTYVGAYLIFHIFFSLYFLFKQKASNWRWYYLGAVILEVFILLNTQTRGALLGLAAGIISWGILMAWFSRNNRLRQGALAAVILFFVLAGAFWALNDQAWVRNLPGIGRLADTSLESITVQNRLMSWDSAFKGWEERPIIGYGYENFNIVFNKHFNPKIYRDPGSRIWFDRAHNVFIDQLVYGGILGLLAYLSLFGAALLILRKAAKESLLAIAAISILIAYAIQNFFVFDCLASFIMFYLVLGLAGFFEKPDALEPDDSQKRAPSILLVIILVMVAGFSLYHFNIRLALANHHIAKGVAYARADNYQASMAEFEKALADFSNQAPEGRQNLVNAVNRAVGSNNLTNQEKANLCEFSISEIEKNVERAPRDVYGHLFLMNALNYCAQFDNTRLIRIIETGEEAVAMSPTRSQFYYLMGQAAINLGRIEQGIGYFKKGAEISPHVVEAHWNLAAVYIVTGQEELAEKEFAWMEENLAFEYDSIKNLERLINSYYRIKDYGKVAEIYQRMIQLQPDNFNYYAGLAAVYREMGEIEKARQMVEKAVELNPDLAEEAKTFLELLEQE